MHHTRLNFLSCGILYLTLCVEPAEELLHTKTHINIIQISSLHLPATYQRSIPRKQLPIVGLSQVANDIK